MKLNLDILERGSHQQDGLAIGDQQRRIARREMIRRACRHGLPEDGIFGRA
jgi:hypothetical protein